MIYKLVNKKLKTLETSRDWLTLKKETSLKMLQRNYQAVKSKETWFENYYFYLLKQDTL